MHLYEIMGGAISCSDRCFPARAPAENGASQSNDLQSLEPAELAPCACRYCLVVRLTPPGAPNGGMAGLRADFPGPEERTVRPTPQSLATHFHRGW